jgi:ATP phosphoribosyltransferase regulatory subunit
MGRWKRNIPEGTRDILFNDCALKSKLEQGIKGLYLGRGYMEITTPTIEFYDVFDGENMWIDQEKMYKFLDQNGRIMVLRPDITTPVARIAGTKLKESYYPLKFFYSLNVFRCNEKLNAKSNEATQCGVEIIGIGNLRADVEVIVTAIKALLEIGIEDFKIELGHAQFFKGIMEENNVDGSEIEKIRRYIEDKNFASLRFFLENKEMNNTTISEISALPRLFGDIDVIEKARKLTINKKALSALKDIEEIYKALDDIGLSKYFSVDLGMVHQIDYYTGVIFRAYVDGAGNDVLYGGRYDNLIENFGINLPATGFALNLDNITEIIKRQGKKVVDLSEDFLIYYDNSQIGEANKLAEDLRSKGYVCELSLIENIDDNISYAERRKIKNIIELNKDGSSYILDVENKTRQLCYMGGKL